jgi:hypothetical protein
LDEPNQKVESPNKAIDCMSSLPRPSGDLSISGDR